jgi:hypothetical protein
MSRLKPVMDRHNTWNLGRQHDVETWCVRNNLGIWLGTGRGITIAGGSLGRSGISTTAVGLGCWAIGGTATNLGLPMGWSPPLLRTPWRWRA